KLHETRTTVCISRTRPSRATQEEKVDNFRNSTRSGSQRQRDCDASWDDDRDGAAFFSTSIGWDRGCSRGDDVWTFDQSLNVASPLLFLFSSLPAEMIPVLAHCPRTRTRLTGFRFTSSSGFRVSPVLIHDTTTHDDCYHDQRAGGGQKGARERASRGLENALESLSAS
ncbi:hypothetical protein FRC16_005229, partial [Serendipita sp. 398]